MSSTPGERFRAAMAEEKPQVRKPFKGAKVDWPADMPDDMLEDVITVAKNALETHDFEE